MKCNSRARPLCKLTFQYQQPMSISFHCGMILKVIFRPTRSDVRHWVRYLDYLNKVAPDNPSLKTEDFPDQKRAPSTPNSSIYNRDPFSQARHHVRPASTKICCSQRAIACNGLRQRWQVWHCLQCRICKLPNRRGGRGFESPPLRQQRLTSHSNLMHDFLQGSASFLGSPSRGSPGIWY